MDVDLDLEQTFKNLAAQFVEKRGELAALEVEQRASQARLDERLHAEAEGQVNLKRVLDELTTARNELTLARRNADKIVAMAQEQGAQIRFKAQQEAEQFLQDVRTAVGVAANAIDKWKAA